MPSQNSVICSQHFTTEDFEPQADHRKRRDLKRSATPSLFDFPPHLLPKKPKPRKPPKERSSEPSTSKSEENQSNKNDLPVNDSTFKVVQFDHNYSFRDAKENRSDEVELPEDDSTLKVVELDHNYSFPDAKELKKRLQESEERIKDLQKKLLTEKKKSFKHRKQALKHKKKKQDLHQALRRMKSEGFLDSQGTEHLQTLMTPSLLQIFRRINSNKESPTTSEFPAELRVFATTLQFYSTKAYKYVRKTFCKALPHVATIRRWLSNIDGSPGFSEPAFTLLKKKQEEEEALRKKKIYVTVMLDEMSLKKQVEYNSKASSFQGYINLGTETEIGSRNSKPATDALVIMAVGVNCHFKIPLGYFFIAGNFVIIKVKRD